MTSPPLEERSGVGPLNRWPLPQDRSYSLQSQKIDTEVGATSSASAPPNKNTRSRMSSSAAAGAASRRGSSNGQKPTDSAGHGAEIASLRSAVTELQRAVTQVQSASSSNAAAAPAAAPMRPVTLFPLGGGSGGGGAPSTTQPIAVVPPVAPQVLLVTTPRGASSLASGGASGGVLLDEISSMRQHVAELRQQVELAKLRKQRQRSKKGHHRDEHRRSTAADSVEDGGTGGGCRCSCSCGHAPPSCYHSCSGAHHHHRHPHASGRGGRRLPPLADGGAALDGASSGSGSNSFEDVATMTAVPHGTDGWLGKPGRGPLKQQVQSLRSVMDRYNQLEPLPLTPDTRGAGASHHWCAGGGSAGSLIAPQLLEQVDAIHRSLDTQHQALIRQQERVLREQEDELLQTLHAKERRELEAQQRERDMLEAQYQQEEEMQLLLLAQQQQQRQLLQQQQAHHQIELLQQQAQAAAMAQSVADSVRAETEARAQAQAQAQAEAEAKALAQQAQLLAQLEAERHRALREEKQHRNDHRHRRKKNRGRSSNSSSSDDDFAHTSSESDADDRNEDKRGGRRKSGSKSSPQSRGGRRGSRHKPSKNRKGNREGGGETSHGNNDPVSVSSQVRRLQNSLDEMNIKHLAELKRLEERERQTEEEYKQKLENLKAAMRAEREKTAEERQRQREREQEQKEKEKKQREKERKQKEKEREKLKKQKEKEKEKKKKEREREKAKAAKTAAAAAAAAASRSGSPAMMPYGPAPGSSYYPTPIPTPRDPAGEPYSLHAASAYPPYPLVAPYDPSNPYGGPADTGAGGPSHLSDRNGYENTIPYPLVAPPYDTGGAARPGSYSSLPPHSAREPTSSRPSGGGGHHLSPPEDEHLDADPLLPPQSGRRTPGVGLTDLERKVNRLGEDCRRTTQQLDETGNDANREAHVRGPLVAATRRVEEVGGMLEQLQRDMSGVSRELQASNAAAARGAAGDESHTGGALVTFEQLQLLRDQLVDHKRRHEMAVDQAHEVLLATRQQAQREMDKLLQQLSSLDREFEHTTEDRDSVADALAKVVAVVNEDSERLKRHDEGPIDKDLEQRHRQHQEQLRDQKERMKEVDKRLRDIQRQLAEGRNQYGTVVDGFGRDLTRGEEKLHKVAEAGERQMKDLADQLRRLNSTQSATERKMTENARKKAEKEKQKREKEKQKEKERRTKQKQKEKQKAKARNARLQALAAMGIKPPRSPSPPSESMIDHTGGTMRAHGGAGGGGYPAQEYDTGLLTKGTESGSQQPYDHRYSQLSTLSGGMPGYNRIPSMPSGQHLSPQQASVQQLPSLGKPKPGESLVHQQSPSNASTMNTPQKHPTGVLVRANTDHMLITSVADSALGPVGPGLSGEEMLSDSSMYPQATPIGTTGQHMSQQYRGSGGSLPLPKRGSGGGSAIQFLPNNNNNNNNNGSNNGPESPPNSILTSLPQAISPTKYTGRDGAIGDSTSRATVAQGSSEEAERQLRDQLRRERDQHDNEIRALRQQLSDERHRHDSALQKLRDEELGPALNKLASANDNETASLLQQLREERARHQEEMDAMQKTLEEERARKREADRKAAQLKSLADNEATAVDSLQDQLRQEQLRHQEEIAALRRELEEAKARALAAEQAAKRAAAAGDDHRRPGRGDGDDEGAGNAAASHKNSSGSGSVADNKSGSAERLRKELAEERLRHEREMEAAAAKLAEEQRRREAQLNDLQDQLQQRQRELEELRRLEEEARERERAAAASVEPNETVEALKEKYLQEQDHHHEEMAQLKEKLERSERNAAAATKRMRDMLAYTGKDPEADAKAKEMEYQIREADRKMQLALLRQRETHREEMQALRDEKEKEVKDMQVLLDAERRKEAFEMKQREEERKRLQLAVDARDDDLHKMEKVVKDQEKMLRSPRATSTSLPGSMSPTHRSLNASPFRQKKQRGSMSFMSGSVGNSMRRSGNGSGRQIDLPELDTDNLNTDITDPLHSHRSVPSSSRVPAKIYTMVQGGEWLKEKYKEEPVYAKRAESEGSELGSMELLTPARIRKGKVLPVGEQPLFKHTSSVTGQGYTEEKLAGDVVAHEE